MSQPFVLPAGLEIGLGPTLSLHYDGDVILENSLGRPLGDVHVTGDLTVRLESISGSLHAGGKLVLEGKIEADALRGAEIIIGNQDVKCRSIAATERIQIGGAKLGVDIIIAPEIQFDPKANGRVTVIESRNEPGPTKIKGGFSLKEYEEVVGDSATFLAERGVSSLDEEPLPPRASVSRTQTGQTPTIAATPAPPPKAAPPPPAPPPEEDVSDPLSLSVEDLEPVAEQQSEPEDDDDELHPKLLDAVKRIAACYEGKETPPAVENLRDLVEARDYDRLRDNITEVWNGLLGFHQKKGIRPHHQVTHAFNVIHGLVQQIQ